MVKFVPLNRADRQVALIVFALASAFYARMAAPDVLGGDPGEFHFAAWTFGLAHPTGYPLYLILGGLWQHLLALIGMSPARSLNLLSALTGGGAIALLFLLLRRWMSGPVLLSRAAALVGAVMLLVNPTFWSQSLIAEVYALHAFLLILILYAAQSIEIASDSATGAGLSRYLMLAFLVGVGLTHHGTTLLLLPGLVFYLTLVAPGWWRSLGRLLLMIVTAGLPLLLYAYIPLRSGPDASPWYHQRLGDGVLTLYDGSMAAFVKFLTGQSISVGFLNAADAWGRMGQAGALWRLHYYWPGIILMLAGIVILFMQKRRAVLALTLTYVILQQIFNLFYAIDDILVYYIPMYVTAAIWIGFAADWMILGVESGLAAVDSPKPEKNAAAKGDAETEDAADDVGAEDADSDVALQQRDEPAAPMDEEPVHAKPAADAPSDSRTDPVEEKRPQELQRYAFSLIVVVVLALLPWRLFNAYRDVLDQSNETTARDSWEAIMAAQPPEDAILISNDRNEIVPLFYLQTVENRGAGMTGLFPLMAPDERFADLGATIDTALAVGAPQAVVLIKEMPGLDVKVDLRPLDAPLVAVEGSAAAQAPAVDVGADYGPLALTGYDWMPTQDGVEVRLHWLVNQTVDGEYTTTVQLFDAAGNKLAQNDAPPGGVYYPTSLWRAGETLVETHRLSDATDAVELLVSMYTGPEFEPLADPLRISVE